MDPAVHAATLLTIVLPAKSMEMDPSLVHLVQMGTTSTTLILAAGPVLQLV